MMEQDQFRKEIQEAIKAADRALYYLEQARRSLGSARGWGLYDMIAGGFFSTMFKHSSMNKAEGYLKDARTALREFNRELDDVDEMIDFSYNKTDLLTFADYFADGFLVDFLMQGRIKEAVRNVDDTIRKVTVVRNELKQKLHSL
ncbi:MAG: hypothetical protein K6E83_10935 [Clostridium sp.]|nr:hypothetical protein [Clostridium sp.]